MIARAALALGLLASGCLKAIAPEVGPLEVACTGASCVDGGSAGCSNADSDPASSVGFGAEILDGVFRRGGCTKCHSGDGIGLAQSGLELSSYATLRTGGGRSGARVVVDFMPCQSVLAQKVGTAPPFGRRMPYNGPPYLAPADIQLIEDWLAEGARDN